MSCSSGDGGHVGKVSRAGRQPLAVLPGVDHRVGTPLGGLIRPMGHGRYAVLDGHVRTDEPNRPDGQIHVGLGMLLEDSGEHLLDPFAALSGLALFTDDLSVRYEQRRDRLGISRVVGLGKRLDGQPDRLLVLLDAPGRGGRRACRVGLGGRVSRCGLLRSYGNRHRDQREGHPCRGQNTSHGLQPFTLGI